METRCWHIITREDDNISFDIQLERGFTDCGGFLVWSSLHYCMFQHLSHIIRVLLNSLWVLMMRQ